MRVIIATVLATVAAAADPLPVPVQIAVPGDTATAASPAGYPDGPGLDARRSIVVDVLAREDLARWRRGFFAGGDPGKYLPGAAFARLLRDPDDAEAMRYLTDERSPKEHYHFAALNWARLWPLLRDRFPAEMRVRFEASAARYADYADGKGTENHRTMSGCAGLVLADWVEGPRLGGLAKEQLRERRLAWLRDYVRGTAMAGNGEWDSCTYLGFTLNGLLAVYDFSRDERARLWARAGLDLLVAGYALKYSDGVFCAPNQRGHARLPATAITDQLGWMWWGATAPTATGAFADFRYSLHAGTSGWRPGRTLTRIALKQVPMPVEQYNTKGNYWFGQEKTPEPGAWYESVTLHPGLTMGALWKGFGGQTTRFQAVATGGAGAVTLTAGSPVGRNDGDGSVQRDKWFDGGGMHDQTALVGTTLVQISRFPAGEPQSLAHVVLPPGTEPVRRGDWWLIPLGEAWIGVKGLGHPGDRTRSASVAHAAPDPKRRVAVHDLIVFPGPQVGMVLVGIPPAAAAGREVDAIAADLAARVPVFAEGDRVRTSTWDGREILVTRGAQGVPGVEVDGAPIPWRAAAVYAGPILNLEAGVLTAWDGQEGFRLDTTGELPVWSPWRP